MRRTLHLIPERVWVYRDWPGPFTGFRHSFIPWTSGDEYFRKTLVLPFGPVAVVIAYGWIKFSDLDGVFTANDLREHRRFRRMIDRYGPIKKWPANKHHRHEFHP